MEARNQANMYWAAVRYALPRASGIVYDVYDWTEEVLPVLGWRVKEIADEIKAEYNKAWEELDNMGANAQHWLEVYKLLVNYLVK